MMEEENNDEERTEEDSPEVKEAGEEENNEDINEVKNEEVNNEESENNSDKTLLVMFSHNPGKIDIETSQKRAWHLFDSKGIDYEVVAGDLPEFKDRRNELFGISGKTGVYPQFFFKSEETLEFIGDWDYISKLNEMSEANLPSEDLQQNPDLITWEKVFGDKQEPIERNGHFPYEPLPGQENAQSSSKIKRVEPKRYPTSLNSSSSITAPQEKKTNSSTPEIPESEKDEKDISELDEGNDKPLPLPSRSDISTSTEGKWGRKFVSERWSTPKSTDSSDASFTANNRKISGPAGSGDAITPRAKWEPAPKKAFSTSPPWAAKTKMNANQDSGGVGGKGNDKPGDSAVSSVPPPKSKWEPPKKDKDFSKAPPWATKPRINANNDSGGGGGKEEGKADDTAAGRIPPPKSKWEPPNSKTPPWALKAKKNAALDENKGAGGDTTTGSATPKVKWGAPPKKSFSPASSQQIDSPKLSWASQRQNIGASGSSDDGDGAPSKGRGGAVKNAALDENKGAGGDTTTGSAPPKVKWGAPPKKSFSPASSQQIDGPKLSWASQQQNIGASGSGDDGDGAPSKGRGGAVKNAALDENKGAGGDTTTGSAPPKVMWGAPPKKSFSLASSQQIDGPKLSWASQQQNIGASGSSDNGDGAPSKGRGEAPPKKNFYTSPAWISSRQIPSSQPAWASKQASRVVSVAGDGVDKPDDGNGPKVKQWTPPAKNSFSTTPSWASPKLPKEKDDTKNTKNKGDHGVGVSLTGKYQPPAKKTFSKTPTWASPKPSTDKDNDEKMKDRTKQTLDPPLVHSPKPSRKNFAPEPAWALKKTDKGSDKPTNENIFQKSAPSNAPKIYASRSLDESPKRSREGVKSRASYGGGVPPPPKTKWEPPRNKFSGRASWEPKPKSYEAAEENKAPEEGTATEGVPKTKKWNPPKKSFSGNTPVWATKVNSNNNAPVPESGENSNKSEPAKKLNAEGEGGGEVTTTIKSPNREVLKTRYDVTGNATVTAPGDLDISTPDNTTVDPKPKQQSKITKFYSLQELQNHSVPGVDSVHIEQYLSPEDFEDAFNMSKEEFAKLKNWKKDQLKQVAGLF